MKPTRLQIERWIVGDLGEDELQAIEAAFEVDPDLRRRAEALAREVSAVHVPPLRPSRRTRGSLMLPLAVAAAAALFVVVAVVAPDAERFRGRGFDLDLVHVRMGIVRPVGAVVEARSGDRLQWTVEPERDGYVHVFDVQDNGAVQAWMPARFTPAHGLAEGAVLMDAYPGRERLYVLVSPRPVEVADVEHALAKAYHVSLAELDTLPGLGRDVAQRSILVLEAP